MFAKVQSSSHWTTTAKSVRSLRLSYDKGYTDTFHSPGIEPWILGFLKSKNSLGKVLDVGCGLGFTGMLLRLYLGNVEYIVGVDISAEKILKASKLSLYDELHVTDIRNFEPETKFDTVMALEVLHGLPADVLLLPYLVFPTGLMSKTLLIRAMKSIDTCCEAFCWWI